MVVRGRYNNEDDLGEPSTNGHTESPFPYDIISEPTTRDGQSNGGHAYPVDKKMTRQHGYTARSGAVVYTPLVSSLSSSNPSSRLPQGPSSFSPSVRVSNQVRQTVRTLVRNLVLNSESPDLLDSCANACRTYHLNLSHLLQESFIEGYSPIYWAIVKGRNALLPPLLIHAAPVSQSTKSEMRLACLVTANQQLFQSLRCRRGSVRSELTPLSRSCGRSMS